MKTFFAKVPPYLAWSLGLLLPLLGALERDAHAQAAAQPLSCEPIERELATAQSERDKLEAELRAARGLAADAEAARASLERAERELAESSAAVSSCKNAQKELCVATGSFAHGLSTGQVVVGVAGECIDPSARHALAEQLSGWSNVNSTLGQLGAFAAGESDALPGLGRSSGSRVEKLMARLFAPGNGTPLVYRRLLLEAVRQVAPRSLAALKAKTGGVDRWFASQAPLDDAMVAEVHQGAAKRVSGSPDEPAPLSAALGLVSAYQLIARCETPQTARDCRRAAQLRQMLESSGPLVTRRRLQDVWASECSSLTDGVVKKWLEDLPAAHASVEQTETLARAIHSKLLTCFLRDSTAGESFSGWLPTKLPSSAALTTRTLEHLLKLERLWQPGSATDVCARAVRRMQSLPYPKACSSAPELTSDLRGWSNLTLPPGADGAFGFGLCDRFARALFSGENATLPNAFPAPPTMEDAVSIVASAPATNMARLRGMCGERAGRGEAFETTLRELASLASQLGEDPAQPPWSVDAARLEPLEKLRFERSHGFLPWLESLTNGADACSRLELGGERCLACQALADDSRYDCELLQRRQASWTRNTRALSWGSVSLLGLACLSVWAFRLSRARRIHGAWLERATAHVRGMGLEPRVDRLRHLFPSRFDRLELTLPQTPAWERWGQRAVLIRSHARRLLDRDVHRAALTARAIGAELAILVHDDDASADLSAVRAMLEWTARGSGKAAHVLPLTWSRLEWSHAASDLLELAEESSLRTNPFEVRGRVTSSAQFFDRERLVSGLLASTQAGHFTVITGLRRFGKSSLALEVARRLPGPSAYVDLAGFHHELRFSKDPADAADAILRFLCVTLLESARARYPGAALSLEAPAGAVDATSLTLWFRNFCYELSQRGQGKTPPVLLILDELEHAIGAAQELNHALDAFAILVGRLRNCLPASSHDGAQRVGVLFCSALHPLLWSPLGTLAHQSLIGSFDYVAVPCLPAEAATAMMRGLGSRQGIRFTDAALELLVRESQSVPLLLRRLGTAVLELYDSERARQGALGAIEIGVEGVRAALEREESEGSPLRVWIESEIAEPSSPGGAILRLLAQTEVAAAKELRQLAARAFRRQFEITGVALALTPDEAGRRAEEAAGVVVRTLGDSGLLTPHGDPTEPETYELPDGVIRRVLQAASSTLERAATPPLSESPNARRER